MANRIRGEVTMVCGQRSFILRPSFQALLEIEEDLGAGLVEIARRIAERRYGIKDLLAIATAGARAVDPEVRREDVGQAIAEVGLQAASGPVLLFLSYALGGPEEKKTGTRGVDGKIDWGAYLKAAVLALQWDPIRFWDTTPVEFWLCYEAQAAMRQGAANFKALNRDEIAKLAQMQARFPDEISRGSSARGQCKGLGGLRLG